MRINEWLIYRHGTDESEQRYSLSPSTGPVFHLKAIANTLSSSPMEQPKKLSDFPVTSSDKIRYADTDRQGHVNNAVFSTFLETGRVEILYGDHLDPESAEVSFVIASLQIDFRAEINWPDTVDIGTGLIKIGRTSFHLYQCLYQNDRLVAEAITVIVQVSNETKKSVAISSEFKSLLEAFLIDRLDH